MRSARRWAVVLGAVVVFGAAPLQSREVSLDEIVDCRLAVERVLWDAREWPSANPVPKPAFDAVIDREDIRRQIETMLRNAYAVTHAGRARYDRQTLERELRRMADSSGDPALLARMFAAAGDGTRAAACIALPDLVAGSFAALGREQPDADPSRARPILSLRGMGGIMLPRLDQPLVKGLVAPVQPLTPDARYGHATAWTGAEMVVWGGSNGEELFGDGARYVPATDTWIPLPKAGRPSARWFVSVVWTGVDVVFWGGAATSGGGVAAPLGARYRPAADAWGPVATLGAPAARYQHTTVWTGSRMIVWGGIGDGFAVLEDGGAYDPGGNLWEPLPSAPSGSARYLASGAWTGTEMLVWGGEGAGAMHLATGLRYAPGTPGTWSGMNLSGAPAARSLHAAQWFGPPVSRLVIWGGKNGPSQPLGDGGRYDPATNEWSAMGPGAPTARYWHTTVATGTEMVVWGGTADGLNGFSTGARYSALGNAWIGSTPTSAAPTGRLLHTAVPTVDSMIVWGGFDSGVPLISGGTLATESGSWSGTARPAHCGGIPGNAVPNCGFEEGDPPAGWVGSGPRRRDRAVFRGGAASLAVEGGGANNSLVILQSSCLPLEPGRRYEYGFQMRLRPQEPAYCARILVTFSDSGCSSAPATLSAEIPLPAPGEWLDVRETFHATNAFYIGAEIRILCARNDLQPFAVNFDDAFFAAAPEGVFVDGFEAQ